MIGSSLTVVGWCLAAAAIAALMFARRALGVRREAVARACHELRGPLTAVLLGLGPADRPGGLPPARIRAIELELARAALALEDLESARPAWPGYPGPGRAEQVDVGELLADSVEAWRAAAACRGVELRVSWSGPRALVTGHRPRLAQATGNLIANAIEHGGGQVLVSGRLRARCVRIEVLDGGAGLSEPVAKLIRRPKPGPRHGHGLWHGHGLRIADAIATAHGGRLAAAPGDGGARLVLELPAARHPESAHAEPH